jgi:hypothetical protein
MANKQNLKQTLPAPEKHLLIPNQAQWLAGEGAGSWFHIVYDNNYEIFRFSSEGKIECRGIFKIINNNFFNINEPYQFIHLSHCQTVRIKQNNLLIDLKREH